MQFDVIPPLQVINKTITALEGRGVHAEITPDRNEALAKARSMIPDGATVMTGASVTLDQIGFTDLLISGAHPWINLEAPLLDETDPARQFELRRQAVLADYFLGSVHAITQTGETVTASASGSQLPAYAFTAKNVIWVAGVQKIVPGLDAATKRVREYVLPLEDRRMKSTGARGSTIGKMLVFEREISPLRKITMILVNEALGF